MTTGRIFVFLLAFFVISNASKIKLHNKLYYEIVSKNANSNIIYSPVSIQLCVALAHLGAKGQTQEEIAHVLGYGSDFDSRNMTNIIQRLHDQNNALQIANIVYVQSGHIVDSRYAKSVIENLRSDIESINFSQNEPAAKTMNDWIEEHTNHKIKDMIKPSMLGGDTLMMLVNAVYFKGTWFSEFGEGQQEDFTNSDGSVVKTQLMSNQDDFEVGHFESIGAHIVKLNYYKTNIAMYVIIPDETQGLAAIEHNVDKINFREIKPQLKHEYIQFYMPKFTFEFETSLKEILIKLGMLTAFSDNADFSGMLQNKEFMKIADALHKVFIKVDEKGTEAAAVTVMRLMQASLRFPTKTIKADHPFMFAIVSEDYDVPLFMGAVKHL